MFEAMAMKITFNSIKEFTEELKERRINTIRRDFVSELEVSKGDRPINFTHIVCYITAVAPNVPGDGEVERVLLETKDVIYTTPSVMVEHERENIKTTIENCDNRLKEVFEGLVIKHGRIVEP
jgi:hypothetical protein